ncbi:MAG: helicase-related protein, partial [Oscillospiraceae bacterium]
KDISVGFLNGRQTPQEKEQVMSLFIENKISVLVSTTVIEVGVDVPNAVVMMVENAERFGLSQLHQLRGRVGRGGDESYCILATDSKNQDTLERIKVLCNSNDGFFIAEEDLRLRGPGDILGSRQHGEPLFKNADLIKDGEVFEKANIAVDSMLKNPNWREAYPLLDLTCCEVQKKLGLN